MDQVDAPEERKDQYYIEDQVRHEEGEARNDDPCKEPSYGCVNLDSLSRGHKVEGEGQAKAPAIADRRARGGSDTHALNPVDHLIAKVGIPMVQAVESYYKKYCEQPNEKNAKRYCLWRLRLHRRLNNDRAVLESINEARTLGLNDDFPGKTCWDLTFE